MAEIKRFSNKSTIANGTEDTNLSLNDILISQHISGDNSDYKLSLSQVQAIPYGVCSSASASDKTVTFSNFPASFTAQVGTRILVKFTNKNTKGSVSAGTYPTLTAGGVTKPIAAQGKTIGTGAITAGQIVELTLTPDYWNIDQDVREVGTDYTIMANGDNAYTKTQIDSALSDLHCVSSTPTIYLDPDRWGTYTINYAEMQRIGDIYICFGSIIVGEDASSSNLYIRVNTSFARQNGWRLSSKWEVLNNDDYSGMLVSQGNTSLWLIKGAYTTDAGKVKGTELAGQTVTFTFIASKFDFPSTTSES